MQLPAAAKYGRARKLAKGKSSKTLPSIYSPGMLKTEGLGCQGLLRVQ